MGAVLTSSTENAIQEHTRYFIYYIQAAGTEHETLMYREATGMWLPDPLKAHLWASEEFAIKKAKELKKLERQFGMGRYSKVVDIHIGTVNVQPVTLDWKTI